MPSDPTILAFDTSAAHCAAALLVGGRIVASWHEDMAKGQAERLLGLLEEVLVEGGVTWKDLDAIGVGVGPGNFTGIRIGVSTARGLALGLAIPAYGVTGFEARGRLASPGSTVAIPAPREMAYLRHDAGARIVPLAQVRQPVAPDPSPTALAEAIAREAATLWPAIRPAPAPFYVRAPDAAPARDAPPRVLP